MKRRPVWQPSKASRPGRMPRLNKTLLMLTDNPFFEMIHSSMINITTVRNIVRSGSVAALIVFLSALPGYAQKGNEKDKDKDKTKKEWDGDGEIENVEIE